MGANRILTRLDRAPIKRETKLSFPGIAMSIFDAGWNKRESVLVATVAKRYILDVRLG
jgi:hypothetical protein